MIYSVLLVLTLLIGKIVYKTTLNPIIIWGSLWSFVGIMSNVTLFGYYAPSNYVNLIIIIGKRGDHNEHGADIVMFSYCSTGGSFNVETC